jgi:hypothetical protein
MSEKAVQSLKMLYCYAAEDQQWSEKIDLQLNDLKHRCHIFSFFDGELLPGIERKQVLLAQLPTMDLVLLLISAHFKKTSAFWNEISHETWAVQWLGGCRVIALLLEPVDWNNTPFAVRDVIPRKTNLVTDWRQPEPVAPLEVFPSDVKPVTEWQNQEQAFHTIKQNMLLVIEKQWLAKGDFHLTHGAGYEDKEALAAYNEALRLNLSITNAWYGKAHVLNRLKRYEEALAASNEALQLDPTFAWAWHTKGEALKALGQWRAAQQAKHKALQFGWPK